MSLLVLFNQPSAGVSLTSTQAVPAEALTASAQALAKLTATQAVPAEALTATVQGPLVTVSLTSTQLVPSCALDARVSAWTMFAPGSLNTHRKSASTRDKHVERVAPPTTDREDRMMVQAVALLLAAAMHPSYNANANVLVVSDTEA